MIVFSPGDVEMGDQKIPSVIERPLPNGVIYDMSTVGHVRITLPKSSTWSSGLHWHETHDEYLRVVKGTIRVRLGDSRQVISATDGNQPEIKVPRYAWHEWQRAAPDGEEVVVIERTDPDDNDKAIFFWNLNGVILNSPKLLNDKASVVSRLPARLQGLFYRYIGFSNCQDSGVAIAWNGCDSCCSFYLLFVCIKVITSTRKRDYE